MRRPDRASDGTSPRVSSFGHRAVLVRHLLDEPAVVHVGDGWTQVAVLETDHQPMSRLHHRTEGGQRDARIDGGEVRVEAALLEHRSELCCRELVLDDDDHNFARVLIEELAQLFHHLAEEDRAELAELVAEVDVPGRIRRGWAGLGTQVQRMVRWLVSRRLHHPAQPAVGQLGVHDLLVAGRREPSPGTRRPGSRARRPPAGPRCLAPDSGTGSRPRRRSWRCASWPGRPRRGGARRAAPTRCTLA